MALASRRSPVAAITGRDWLMIMVALLLQCRKRVGSGGWRCRRRRCGRAPRRSREPLRDGWRSPSGCGRARGRCSLPAWRRCPRRCRSPGRPRGSRARPNRGPPRRCGCCRWTYSRHTRTRPVDGDGSVGTPDHGGALDLAELDLAGAGGDLGAAPDVADLTLAGAGGDLGAARDTVGGDETEPGIQAQRAGLLEPEVPGRGLEPALPEPAGAADVVGQRVKGHLGIAGQFDGHVDRPGLAGEVEGARLRTGDPEHAARVVDADLLSGFHVGLVGFVARADLDDGVGPGARGDPHVAGAEFERDGNWSGRPRPEIWHGCPSIMGW